MLIFTYGVMGSSKTAQALITRFNYINKGYNVFLIKPAIDTRSAINTIVSRVGLTADCISFKDSDNLVELFEKYNYNIHDRIIVIVDEAQFCTKEQINQLMQISTIYNIDILCYGLKTNFKSEFFEGSKRLFEIADKIIELDYPCKCGKLAIINARVVDNMIVKNGSEIQIGDSEYIPMCYNCWIHNNINSICEVL